MVLYATKDIKQHVLWTPMDKYISIAIGNPTTHDTWEEGKYTTYEISLQTNDRAFTLPKSCVRRRYSEFVSLQKHLSCHQHPDLIVPELPPKKFFSWRFSEEVIAARVKGLKEFLDCLLQQATFLSDSSVHLFLQTSLPWKAISEWLERRDCRPAMDLVLEFGQRSSMFEENSSHVGTSQNNSLLPVANHIHTDSLPVLTPRPILKINGQASPQPVCSSTPIDKLVITDDSLLGSCDPHAMADSAVGSSESDMSADGTYLCADTPGKKKRVRFSKNVSVARVVKVPSSTKEASPEEVATLNRLTLI